jgi:hypothetical protein
MLALHGSACMSPGLLQGAVPSVQQVQVDQALLAQLQLQQQVQQQQGSSLAALSAAGLLGGNGVHLGNGNYALDLTNTSLRAGLYPSGATGGAAVGSNCFVDPSAAAAGAGGATALTGFAGTVMSPFGLNLQQQPLAQQQPLQQLQEQQDLAGLENLALTLSALGLHTGADGHINAATLEAALRQQC